MCACPPLGSCDESLLGAIGQEILETRFHIFIAQDENRAATPFEELSPPVAMLFPAQFASDVGVDEIHDAGEMCRISNAQEDRAVVGEIGISIKGECVLLLGFRNDSQNETGASRGRAHEVTPLNSPNGDFSDGDGVTSQNRSHPIVNPTSLSDFKQRIPLSSVFLSSSYHWRKDYA